MLKLKNHNAISGSSLLAKLLHKGDEIDIVQGKLVIKPSSGLAVPLTWLKQNEALLINDICRLFNIVPLRYISYTTGSYGVKKSQGITLQFSNLQSGEDAYIIYNANLKRTRNSKHAKKGDLLPGKQFIVSERSGFYKFWLSTGLPLPKSPSKFYECIGKLKSLVFISSIDFNNRITDKKLPLLELSFHEILNKHRVALASKKNEELTAKQPLIFRQETAKQPLIFPAKDIEQKLTDNGLAANQSTCTSKCGNTVIRKEVLSTGVGLDNTPINNTNNKEVDENINEVNLQKKRPEDQTADEWLEDWESAFTPEEFDEVMTDFSK
tara:strand:- start:4044 stop:5015 length:972 start_codon:yes stop_codon:yes gene_type:complete